MKKDKLLKKLGLFKKTETAEGVLTLIYFENGYVVTSENVIVVIYYEGIAYVHNLGYKLPEYCNESAVDRFVGGSYKEAQLLAKSGEYGWKFMKEEEQPKVIELKHLVDVFPRVCDATGKGMSEGWMFEDMYFSDQAEADKVEGKYPQYVIDYVKDTWGQTMEEFWAEVESDEDLDNLYYWTEWYELEDCADEAYLADGTLITEGDKGIFSDEKGNLYKIIDYKC